MLVLRELEGPATRGQRGRGPGMAATNDAQRDGKGRRSMMAAAMLHLPGGTYFGRAVARSSLCGLRATETVYRPGESLPWHSHDAAYLVVMLSGTMTEVTARGRDHACARGWLVLDTAGEGHRDHVGPEGARCLNVELRPEWVRKHRTKPYGYAFAGAGMDAVGQLEVAFRRGEPGNGAAKDLFAEAALHRLLDTASGQDATNDRSRGSRGHPPAWMQTVTELLRDSSPGGASLSHLAAAAGVHPAHLCRTFVAHFNCTVGDYARRLRADCALAKVIHGREPLAWVALACGFTDQSHLTRELRRHFALAPAALRHVCGRGANRVQDA